MKKLIILTACDDGGCCCLPPKSAIFLISILSMVVCIVDLRSFDCCRSCCEMTDYVDSMRLVLMWLFQLANMALLASSILANSFLATIYVWYTLGFIIMGLCVCIFDLLVGLSHQGRHAVVTFVVEVLFLFVLSRCLPVVNLYRLHLENLSHH